MSRSPASLADQRWRLVAAGLVAALAFAACGGSSSQAPTTGPDQTSGPGDSEAPGDSQAPGDTDGPNGGDGGEAFTAATTALDALDSYSYSVTIASEGGTSGTTHTKMSGVVFNAPEEASLLTMAELDEASNITSSSSFLIIGEAAWSTDDVEIDGSTEWTSIPAEQAAMFIQTFANYRPEQMFSLYFAGYGGNFGEVGTETKNGVETKHFQGDEALGTILGGIVGVQGQWSSDAWIATDGGYLVHSEANVEGEAGTTGSFSIVVDINDINSAEALRAP